MGEEIDGNSPEGMKITADANGIKAQAAGQAQQKEIVKSDFKYLQKAKVLVVDDSKPIRMMMTRTLSLVGAANDEAVDGKQAFEKMKAEAKKGKPFDIVISDFHMPVMDGLGLLKTLRGNDDLKGTPVVMVTTEGDRKSVLQFVRYGIASYVLKPFKTQQLLEVVETALAAKEEVQEDSSVSTSVSSNSNGGSNDGLSREQVDQLRTAAYSAAMEAVNGGQLFRVKDVDDEPVWIALRNFIDKHCPDL